MYDERVNEVSLLYFGQPEELNSPLLLNLNILEFREKTPEYKGLYLLENKFGKEVFLSLSVKFEDRNSEWLVYRYMSDLEIELLKHSNGSRRIYVLLQNYMNLEYFLKHTDPEDTSYYFIVGRTESVKSITHIADRLKTKNILVAKKVEKPKSEKKPQEAGSPVPEFIAAFLKLLLNPIDELNRLSSNLMHSNLRVLYRLAELLRFIHFVISMSFVMIFKVLWVQMFWRTVNTIGFLKVYTIKIKYWVRHLFLMSFYKVWGVLVDIGNFLIRVKDLFVLTVYYRTLHYVFHNNIRPFYFKSVHSLMHEIWLRVFSPLYYKVIRALFIQVLNVIKAFYYKVLRTLFFKILGVLQVIYYKAILKLYYAAVKLFYYEGILKLYYETAKLSGYIWENALSPVYFATIHKIIHKALIPLASWIYFKIFHRVYHEIYKVLNRLYHSVLKASISWLYYKSIHSLYHRVLKPFFTFIWFEVILGQVFYNFLHRIYYKAVVIAYYQMWPWVKFNILIKAHHLFVFKIRHYFLIAMFKSYGLLYDLVMFVARITKLYLMYPFFKIYWFISFQYNKRIKKFFA